MFTFDMIDRRSQKVVARLSVPNAQMLAPLARTNANRFEYRPVPTCRPQRVPKPKPAPLLGFRPYGRVMVWIVRVDTGEIAGTACGQTQQDAVANALVAMKMPSLEDARRTFVLQRRKPTGARFEPRTVPCMPWGKYEGCKFTAVPWRYLDRCLSDDLRLRDEPLFDAIQAYLETVPEYRDGKYGDADYCEDVDHLRDFVPSEFRGR
jgi:hypothetical protein